MGRNGQEGQKKTCRKKQHVKKDKGRHVTKTIRCMAAVGKNYNSTRDIDVNQKTRLVSCFEMRCHSGHPGEAPITKYNVLSCFSDIVEIIFANSKFSLDKKEGLE